MIIEWKILQGDFNHGRKWAMLKTGNAPKPCSTKEIAIGKMEKSFRDTQRNWDRYGWKYESHIETETHVLCDAHPPLGKMQSVHILMSPELIDSLNEIAGEKGVGVSQIVREVLQTHVNLLKSVKSTTLQKLGG